MGQDRLDATLYPVKAELRFAVSLGVGCAFRIVAETFPKGRAGLVEPSFFGDDLIYEAAACLNNEEEIVDGFECSANLQVESYVPQSSQCGEYCPFKNCKTS